MINYFIDTNVVRYLSETSTTNSAENNSWLMAAETFLDKVMNEIENDEAYLRIPLEVYRELEIHSLTFSHNTNTQKDSQEIKEYVRLLKSISLHAPFTEYSTEAIHCLRMLSTYIGRFNQRLSNANSDFTFKRGGESDARILCAAYDYEGVIVTGNIKDFLVYLLLDDEMIQKDILYNIKTNQYVKIPDDIFQDIWKDHSFQKLKADFLLALEK